MNGQRPRGANGDALWGRTRQLQAISEAMTVFLDQGDWGRASERLLQGCFDLTASEYGFVGVLVEGPVFRVLAHAGIVWDSTTNREFYENALRTYRELGYLEFRRFDNLFGKVLTSGRPLISNAPADDPAAGGLPPGHPPLHCFLGVPFLWGQEVVGMIGVANRPGGYGAAEQARLQELANAAGVLYDSYRRKQRQAAIEAEHERVDAALRTSNLRLEEALQELQATQQQVVREERLRALGLMASGVAHNLNNALQPILGFSEYLLAGFDSLEDREVVRDCLELIRTAAHDAGEVVKRLSEFGRRRSEREDLAPADLNRLVQQVVSLTRPKWRDEAQARGIDIRVVTELGAIPRLALDESGIREMLTNLIFNAVDAMPAGGTIRLRTRSEARRAILEVSDTGIGMSEEVRRRCLEPFFSTKGAPRTGMGLAMVHEIVARHGGAIELESEAGAGTTFRLRLPLADPARPLPAAAGAAAAAPCAARALRILLIEDEPLVRRSLGRLLRQEGHQVEAVESGPEGLEKARAQHFDLVLSDHSMPGMTGQQVALAIKEREPRTPVILLSGFGEMLKGAEAAGGADLVIAKPVSLEGLRRAIARACPPAPP